MLFAKYVTAQNSLPETIAEHDNTNWVVRSETGFNYFGLGQGATRLSTTAKAFGSIKFGFDYIYRTEHKGTFWGIGLGTAIHEFRFSEHLIFDLQDDILYIQKDPNRANRYGKSKLQLIYFRVPIEVGLKEGHWSFTAGINTNLLLLSKLKRKFEAADEAVRVTQYGNKHIGTNPSQIGVYVRLEYKGVGVYHLQNITALFRERIAFAPEVYATQTGFSFTSIIAKSLKTNRKQNLFNFKPEKSI